MSSRDGEDPDTHEELIGYRSSPVVAGVRRAHYFVGAVGADQTEILRYAHTVKM